MPPFRLQQIDHVVLRVHDLAAMQAFYCDVLGCTQERRQDAIGLVQLRAGTSLIDLVPLGERAGSRSSPAISKTKKPALRRASSTIGAQERTRTSTVLPAST